MIQNLTDTARRYAQARAGARVARDNGAWVECNAAHETAHNLALAADGLAARQITALAEAFAKNRNLACSLTAVIDAELPPQDAA